MDKPIRLGIYVVAFPTASETFIVTKVLGLLDAGFDVAIFTEKPSQHWDRFAALKDRTDVKQRIYLAPPIHPAWKVPVYGSLQVLKTALRHPAAFARFVRHNWQRRHELPSGFLKSLYLRLQFVGHSLDILHIEFDTQALGVIDLADYLGCKVLLSARGTFQKTSVLDRFPNAPHYLYQHVGGYHFISEYLRQNTYRLGLDRTVPTWLIEPAIDLSLFTPPKPRSLRPAGAPLRVISVARLAWQKGYEFAIDAIACLYKAGIPVEYQILGEGSYEEPIRYAARQWGLLDNGVVKLCGAVRREDVPRYLAESDVMLHAAVEEGFCNAVIEAQAMELPVVASNAGGLPENIADGVTGFIVPRRNPEALAEKLTVLARDPALCLQMGKAGRARALARFDLTQQVQAFMALYRELYAQESQKHGNR
ncbi:MAG: glycosyltransferase family 4 protein [Anaerolineae bacterium]|nr:glycosyltransferase family 4 protein [Anaerolineae bacterium]